MAKWYLHHYPKLGEVLSSLRPDVIHLWEEPWSLVGLQAVRLRDRLLPDAAVILETDQNILRRLPPPFQQIRRYNLKRIDLLIGRQPESLEVARALELDGANVAGVGVSGEGISSSNISWLPVRDTSPRTSRPGRAPM